MRLTTNTKKIVLRQKIARYATFGGLAALLGSLVISFTSDNLPVAYALLFVGFVLAFIGATLANKWVKEPRADQAIEKALKGFDNKHHLYNFLLPSDHVLQTPTGILVFKAKIQDGKVACVNGKWNRPWQLSMLFGGMGQEALGNPVAELKNEIALIKKALADKIENAALVPVDGYVVFTNPRVQLSIDDAELPVIQAEDLKDTLRKSKRGAVLSPKTQDDIEKALDELANAKTAK